MQRRRLEKQGSQQDTVKAALLAGMRLNHAMLIKAYGGNKKSDILPILSRAGHAKTPAWQP